MSDAIEFIDSSRGGKLLVYQNHTFRFVTSKASRSYWQCTENGKLGCKASLSLDNNVMEKGEGGQGRGVKVRGEHSHPCFPAKIKKRLFSNKLKERIMSDPQTCPPKILREELAKNVHELQSTPTEDWKTSLEKLMYRTKAKALQNVSQTGSKDDAWQDMDRLLMSTFLRDKVKGVLIDIHGVLYESGNSEAIVGSVNAIERLRKSKLPYRFVTNETQRTRASLVSKLKAYGFSLFEHEIISPGIATASYLKSMNLRPFLLVHPDIEPEFSECERSSPDCVVVGDAAEYFTYANVNEAFKVLIKSEKPLLITMGKGRYYKEKGELVMDLGGYTAALEYATGVTATIIGKPSSDYFKSALNDLGIKAEEAVMIGDDISSDVHAAQKNGMRGVLVKTGKFRDTDLLNSEVHPDAVFDNFAQFVDILLQDK